MKAQPEQLIKKAIINYLNLFPTKLLVIDHKNTGTVRNGIYCPSKTTIKGVSDLIVFPLFDLWDDVRTTYNKIPLFIEVKTPKGKQSSEQKDFQIRVNKLGYSYYVATSIYDIEKILKERGII